MDRDRPKNKKLEPAKPAVKTKEVKKPWFKPNPAIQRVLDEVDGGKGSKSTGS